MKREVLLGFLIMLLCLSFSSAGVIDEGFFYCSDSDDYSYIIHENDEENDEEKTIESMNRRGTFGTRNSFEKGETYGKPYLNSEEFVTTKDSCVILEEIEMNEKDIGRKLDLQKVYGEGSVSIYNSMEDGGSKILRCAGGNCSRVYECDGDNCGVIEYGCGGSFSFRETIVFTSKHPWSFVKELFGGFKINLNKAGVIRCENGCVDGACIKLLEDEEVMNTEPKFPK